MSTASTLLPHLRFGLAAASLVACASSAAPSTGVVDAAPDEAAVAPGPDAPPAPPQCIPGMAIACACADGTTGAQACTPSGSFAPCACAPRADAAVDAPLPADAPPRDAADATADASPDATADASPDATADASPDATADASPDATADASPDASADAPSPCGPGTYPSDIGCVPIPSTDAGLSYYDLRIAVDRVTGDGITAIPVLALGREPDGSPSTRDVVFSLSRVGAGTISPSARLMVAGTQVSFVPCNAATSPACVGSVRVLMALASAPSTPVAVSREIMVTDQVAVGTPAPCLEGGNVAYVTGDATDYITGGRSFTWRDSLVTVRTTSPTLISANVGGTGLSYFNIEFSTNRLGAPLMVGVYENAMRYPFEDTGRPGFSMSGMGRGCNTLRARYQIHEMASDASGLTRFLATFQQNCEGGASAARGCIRWSR